MPFYYSQGHICVEFVENFDFDSGTCIVGLGWFYSDEDIKFDNQLMLDISWNPCDDYSGDAMSVGVRAFAAMLHTRGSTSRLPLQLLFGKECMNLGHYIISECGRIGHSENSWAKSRFKQGVRACIDGTWRQSSMEEVGLYFLGLTSDAHSDATSGNPDATNLDDTMTKS